MKAEAEVVSGEDGAWKGRVGDGVAEDVVGLGLREPEVEESGFGCDSWSLSSMLMALVEQDPEPPLAERVVL